MAADLHARLRCLLAALRRRFRPYRAVYCWSRFEDIFGSVPAHLGVRGTQRRHGQQYEQHRDLWHEATVAFGAAQKYDSFWHHQAYRWPGLRLTLSSGEALGPITATWTATDEAAELWLMLNHEE